MLFTPPSPAGGFWDEKLFSDDVVEIMKTSLYFLAITLWITSCSKEEIAPLTPSQSPAELISIQVDSKGDPVKGLDAYLHRLDKNNRACVTCHLSPSGFDIIAFGKTNPYLQDSIIIQRATFNESNQKGHVSIADAYHIAAYLKKLGKEKSIQPNNNGFVYKRPQGLNPGQVWNGQISLTKGIIQSWNFRTGINIGFDFPSWFSGNEFNSQADENLDFLPEVDLLTKKEGALRLAFDNYQKNPNKYNLRDLIRTSYQVCTEGEINPGEHGYNDFSTAFDFARWKATLYMQHVLAPGSDLQFGEEIDQDLSNFSMADAIWDVGNVARRSQDNGSNINNGKEIENRLRNETSWLYLGWLTNYGKRNSFETQYLGSALKDFGDQDLASLVILKSIVNRSDHSLQIYDDLFSMSYLTSDRMLYESLRFGLNYVTEGLKLNDRHFFLTNSDNKNITLANLKNETNTPNVYQHIQQKTFLTKTQKQELLDKVDLLYSLIQSSY